MKASSKAESRLRFGQLELDLSEGKLLKRGLYVRLENLPFQILAFLLEHPGEVVSREELCSRLWPDGTYVDFDEGLNTAIKKLRYALGDSAENPTFIETLPRKGYRFIASVQGSAIQASEPDDADRPSIPMEIPLKPLASVPPPSKSRRRAAWLTVLAIVFVAFCGLLYRLAFPPALRVTQIVKLTNSAGVDPWGELASDGARLFFLERDGDHWNTRQISVAGGESTAFGSSPRNTRILAVSNDQSEILFAPFGLRSSNLPLWSMPLVGGAPRRVGDILANGAAFSPDGTQIAICNSNGVFVANRDGSGMHQVADRPECWSVAWSPDGKILRFSDRSVHLWQVSPTGHDLHPFLPEWTAREGRWTSDGSYYIFSVRKDGRNSLWALREYSFLPWQRPTPTQLTFPPVSYDGPLLSRDGHVIYAHGGLSELIDTVRFDPVSHQFKPVSLAAQVTEAVASPDGQWMLFSNWHQLWRSRPDGSDRVQLGSSPAVNYAFRWSPDSKHILFHSFSSFSDGNKGTIYLMSSAGGAPQQLLPPGPSRVFPDWLPDGHSISYSVEPEAGRPSTAEAGIYLLNLDHGRSTLIPGSTGLTFPRWSPDGRFLAAVSEDQSAIKLLDVRTHRWSEVARGTLISSPVWSSDFVLYFQDILAPGEPVYRFRPGGASPQRAFSFEDILQTGVQRCGFWGFAPDGSLLVQVNRGGGDLYALTVNYP